MISAAEKRAALAMNTAMPPDVLGLVREIIKSNIIISGQFCRIIFLAVYLMIM